MPKAKSPPKFSVGDAVRVKRGVSDPDFSDIPFGGWAGTISEFEKGSRPAYLITLNEGTLNSIHPIYKKRCERDGLDFDQVWMFEQDLEPDSGEQVQIEQPTSIVSELLSMDNQDDRIRSIFGLTGDDPLPESDDDSLRLYYKHLADNLSFPFDAKYSFDTGPFESKTISITVLGLLDANTFQGDGYGLFCCARRDRKKIELPLTEVEVSDRNLNRRLVADYSFWFVNW